jgi:hypothetical protein
MHVLQTRRHELGSTWHPSLRSWPAWQRRWPEVDAAMTSTELLAVRVLSGALLARQAGTASSRVLSGAVREVACGKVGRWTRAKDAGFDYLRASRMSIEVL